MYRNDEAIVIAVNVDLMVVNEVVVVLSSVAVMMWWCKLGVTGNSCCSGGCLAADLVYTIWGSAAVSIHIFI
jgi:hypothetical protein